MHRSLSGCLVFVFSWVLLGLLPRQGAAQTLLVGPPVLREASLRTDTATYLLSRNTVVQAGGPALYFWYRREDETVELRLYPANVAINRPLRLHRSPDYQLLDSLSKEADGSFRTRLRFQNLTSSRFPRLCWNRPPTRPAKSPCGR